MLKYFPNNSIRWDVVGVWWILYSLTSINVLGTKQIPSPLLGTWQGCFPASLAGGVVPHLSSKWNDSPKSVSPGCLLPSRCASIMPFFPCHWDMTEQPIGCGQRWQGLGWKDPGARVPVWRRAGCQPETPAWTIMGARNRDPVRIYLLQQFIWH